ncbi:hypothetical protein J2T07_003249 [Luteibacter jiangsuensis]|uniref:Uncharacterized protein n=1 Tax=Luteibacter jiangsuensis TaxID=637577 RepID=A0ABT9T195_9GAMM|nr:hypothetical protein [Luteibacter jiangsuensis]MDQ0011043.1 hypothetical protein [Luteibacter jiangsuensis]
MHRAALTTLGFSFLFLAPCIGSAGTVVVDNIGLDEGNTTGLLEVTSQHYVDAMRAIISDRYKDDYLAIRWEALETSMTNAQVARMEYRFIVNGETRIRVYHALGGAPLGAMAQSAFGGSTPAITPGSPQRPDHMEWSDDLPSPVREAIDYVAADAEDSIFYTGFNDTELRARILPTGTSVLEPFDVDGADRAMDPEFKILRAIEHDLETHAMPGGGSVRGAVGGATCGSCRAAMQTLSDTYGIDIHLTQMFGSLPGRQRDALVASGTAKLRGRRLVNSESGRPLLARDVLADARDQQVRRSLNPSSLKRSFKGIPWRPRSFRLGPLRQSRAGEGSAEGGSTAPNADAMEFPSPQC